MKLTIAQQDLLLGLSVVGHAVSKRNTLPVLGNILLTANEDTNHLKLSATDLEIAVSCELVANVKETGTITMPAKLFTDYVNGVGENLIDIVLIAKNMSLELKSGRYQATLKGIDAAEFPILPEPTALDEPTLSMPLAALCYAINQVAIASAQESSRPALTGIYFVAEGECLDMVATDGYRMAKKTIKLPMPVDQRTTAIVPAKSCREVARLGKLFDEEATALLSIKGNALGIRILTDEDMPIKNLVINSSLIDAKFSDYNAIVPKNHTTRTVFDLAALQRAIKLATPFADGSSDRVRIKVIPGTEGAPGTLETYAQSAEVGDCQGEIDALVEGDGIEFYGNAQYVTEGLASLNTEQVTLETTRPIQPFVMKRTGDEESFVYLVMPMDKNR